MTFDPALSDGPAPERTVYRDERYLVLWDGIYYILYDLFTRTRKYYSDVRDIFRIMNREEQEESLEV